jgi:tetratricopeptide (TPR) repeat protein
MYRIQQSLTYVISILSIVVLFSCSANKNSKQDQSGLWDGANQADANNDFKKSITLYDQIIASNFSKTSNAAAFTNRGRAKVAIGDTINGIVDLEKAIAIQPSYHNLLSRGMIEFNKDPAKSLQYFLRAKRVAPTESKVYYTLLGYYSYSRQVKDSAIYYADYALQHFETTPMQLEQLMSTYLNFQEYKQLAIVSSKIIANDRNHAFAYNNRGFAEMELDDYLAAEHDIKKSLNLDSQNSYAYKNLGVLYLKTNKLDSACILFTKSKELGYSRMYGPEVDSLMNVHCK